MTFVFAVSAACFVAGVFWIFSTLRGVMLIDFSDKTTKDQSRVTLGLVLSALVGLVVGASVATLTSTVVLGITACGTVVAVPQILRRRRAQNLELKRLEAIASFANSIAQVLGGGGSLEVAVLTASANPPSELKEELASLEARVAADGFVEALHHLAETVELAPMQRLLAHLRMAAQQQSAGVRQSLELAAKNIQLDVAVNQTKERARYKKEFEIRALTLIMFALVVFFAMVAPGLIAVYQNGVLGEILMAIVIAIAGSGWILAEQMRKNVQSSDFRLREVKA